jgi:hypothetical protein
LSKRTSGPEATITQKSWKKRILLVRKNDKMEEKLRIVLNRVIYMEFFFFFHLLPLIGQFTWIAGRSLSLSESGVILFWRNFRAIAWKSRKGEAPPPPPQQRDAERLDD